MCGLRNVGKVTNWFRNLRQTSRKRTKKKSARTGDGDDDDDDNFVMLNSGSRAGTPFLHSSSSSSAADDPMDLDGEDYDAGSEEEYQEAVTPPPELFHSPRRFSPARVSPADLDPASYSHLDKSAYPGVRIEDAILLLSFALH
jgi:hypothetical protein